MTRVESLTGAHFTFDKATLTPEGREKVRAAASVLNRYPARNVQVNGYTDSVGSDTYNQRLSQQRADAVTEALIADGVGTGRLTARGFGEASPVASNTTAEGRAENRRVDLILE
jgi:outer membrane protein OmpA-like peptidoglycan-associated protein